MFFCFGFSSFLDTPPIKKNVLWQTPYETSFMPLSSTASSLSPVAICLWLVPLSNPLFAHLLDHRTQLLCLKHSHLWNSNPWGDISLLTQPSAYLPQLHPSVSHSHFSSSMYYLLILLLLTQFNISSLLDTIEPQTCVDLNN